MAGTKWGNAPLSDFAIHRIALAEAGYNYYEYIHARGLRIVMRQNIAETEHLYTKGAWADRATLSYITYDQLA